MKNIRLRRMTPKECFRLMGLTDAEFLRLSKGISDTQLYRMAGNSIVVDCIASVLGEMLGVPYNIENTLKTFPRNEDTADVYACSMRGRATGNDWHSSEHIQVLEFREADISNALTTVCKDNMLIELMEGYSKAELPYTLIGLIEKKNKPNELF